MTHDQLCRAIMPARLRVTPAFSPAIHCCELLYFHDGPHRVGYVSWPQTEPGFLADEKDVRFEPPVVSPAGSGNRAARRAERFGKR